MSTPTVLGKVCITPKGVYDSTAVYVRLDVVNYRGSSYVCLNSCQGVTPSEGECWSLLSEKGEHGDSGEYSLMYIQQTLSDAEKLQARNNLSAVTKSDLIEYVVKAPSGQTVTVTDGVTTQSTVMDSGEEHTFYLPHLGRWTASNGNTSKSVDMAYYGRYSADLRATIMGIKRSTLASTCAWTRTDDSATFNATASVGTTAGQSDFDTMPIYSEIQRVTVGTNDVMVKIPKFYYQRYRDDEGVEYIRISDKLIDGFALHPAFFTDGVVHDYIYVSAYHLSSGYISKTGVANLLNVAMTTFRTNVRAKGSAWSLLDIATDSAIKMLILVEFANNDVQTVIGPGYTNASAQRNCGGADAVANLTGRPTGTANAVSVVWRGIEDYWGNVSSWIDGVNYYSGVIYVSTEPDEYTSNELGNYNRLSFGVPTSTTAAYISQLGYDPDYPWVLLGTAASGAAADTYFADQHIGGGVDVWKAMQGGGVWSGTTANGLFWAYFNHTAATANGSRGARVVYRP